MRRSNLAPYAASTLAVLSLAPAVLAQFTIISATRSLTTNAGAAGATDPNSDSSSAAGEYNNSINSSSTQTLDIEGIFVNGTGIASQDSFADSTTLSGTGSVSCQTTVTPLSIDNPVGNANASANSSYDVVFQVPVPETINLSGNLTGSVPFVFVGFGDSTSASVTLTSNTSTTLYSVSGSAMNTNIFNFPFPPISYSTTLTPGNTYELGLVAQASASENAEAGANPPAFGSNFNFSITAVPEPTTLALFTAAIPLLLRRHRNSIPTRPDRASKLA
jgi:hypothetical protein